MTNLPSRALAFFRRSFRRLLWVYIIAFILLTLWIISFIPISLPAVRNLVTEKISASLGTPVSIGKLTVTLFRSITVEDVSFMNLKAGNNRLDATVKKIRLDYRIMPFQPKKINANGCKIEQADIRLTLPPPENAEAGTRPITLPEIDELTGYLPLSILLEEIHLKRINFAVQSSIKKPLASIRGLETKLYLETIRARGLSGWIDIDTTAIPGVWTFPDLKIRIKTENQALLVEFKKFPLLGGHARAEGEIRPSGKPAVKMRAEIRGVDLQQAYRLAGPKSGRLTGAADLLMDAQSAEILPLVITGSGRLNGRNVEMEKLPIQGMGVVEALLPALCRIDFKTVEAEFDLKPNSLRLTRAEALGRPADFLIRGEIRKTGQLDLTADCLLPPDLAATLPSLFSTSLTTTPAGRKDLPLVINGTVKHPAVSIEAQTASRLVRNTAIGIGQPILNNRGILKQLFK
jgi:hypothetical protein